MKKLTFIPVALMVCAAAYGQGTLLFQNSSSTKAVAPAGFPAFAQGAGYDVDLLYQANTGGAAPAAYVFGGAMGNWVALPAVADAGPPGEYLIGKTTVPATPGPEWLEVVAWNNGTTTATSFATAIAGGASAFGNSPVVTLVLADPTQPTQQPLALTTAAGFTGFTLVATPEPTTIALGGLGAASLLLFRRRK